MKTFIAAALAGFAAASPERAAFMEYILEHGKSYGTVEEYEFRFAQWSELDAKINEHNSSNSTFTLGHNRFSDYTHAEYKKLLGYIEMPLFADNVQTLTNASLPSSVNWVEAGAVTPVKDQGQCGSCWAFSSTGALEGAYQIKNNSLLSFSEQEFVDCVKLSLGCNGGNQITAFNYNKQHYESLEADYAYTGKDGSCNYDNVKHSAERDVSSTQVQPQSSQALMEAIALQPVAVSIEADKYAFQSYKSGVLDSTACGTQLDHAVLAVGYGTENGQDYYLVKNSWNTTWGEEGYVKIANVGDGPGICGIQMAPIYPTV